MLHSSDQAICSWVGVLPSLQGLASVSLSKIETRLLGFFPPCQRVLPLRGLAPSLSRETVLRFRWPLVSRENGDTGHFSQNATPDLTLKLTLNTDPGPRPGAGPTACAGNVAVPDPSTGPDLGPMAL